MVPGGLPHASASPQGQGRRVTPRHGQNGARVDGPGAAVGWRPTRHRWGTGVGRKRPGPAARWRGRTAHVTDSRHPRTEAADGDGG